MIHHDDTNLVTLDNKTGLPGHQSNIFVKYLNLVTITNIGQGVVTFTFMEYIYLCMLQYSCKKQGTIMGLLPSNLVITGNRKCIHKVSEKN